MPCLPLWKFLARFLGALVFAAVIPAATASGPGYVFSHLAGPLGGEGNADGPGTTARFKAPAGIAVSNTGVIFVTDQSGRLMRRVTPQGDVTSLVSSGANQGSEATTGPALGGVAVDGLGNVYVVDQFYHTVRKIAPDLTVTVLAGMAGVVGSDDGTGTAARFNTPEGIAVDGTGNVYVADMLNRTIRKITPAGVVTTFAGTAGVAGHADGVGAAAQFFLPSGVAVDGAGNVYVADQGDSTIRKITPIGAVTTLAGTPGQGTADGVGSAARFNNPTDVAVDGGGNVYVADTNNNAIRKITAAGVVTTLAGTASMTTMGSADGTGAAAQFYYPLRVAAAPNGLVYVADSSNNTLRSISPTGVVVTLAGMAGGQGAVDATGTAARFTDPVSVAVDSAQVVYVADRFNNTIRKITPAGVVTTLAGTPGVSGSADGTGPAAQFKNPSGIAVGSGGTIYVADESNHTIRRITSAGVVTTLVGLAGTPGSADGTGSQARFNEPFGVAVDSAGNLFVADTGNDLIRKVTTAGEVTTLAGTAGMPGSADGTGAAARFNGPFGLAFDPAGNLFVTDQFNASIRKITPGGVVTTLTAGAGPTVQFNSTYGLAIDSAGNLFVADGFSSVIRMVAPDGAVTTVAGTAGVFGSVDGLGHDAQFNYPVGLAINRASGTLYVADLYNHAIRKGELAGPPTITSQPQSQTVVSGATALFSVVASGVPAPTYQWYFNGAAFNGATSSTLNLVNVHPSDAGDYTVVVTNSAGSVTSNKATLTVSAGPVTPPTTPSSDGGGGGAPSLWFYLALFILIALRAGRSRLKLSTVSPI